mmetsp:Transcript_2878/g.9361  ORF Transcript_2878/g.9361 Transcript_2878/m.9361 type:complete len:242 (-) Transcript_2878:2973-3698(-)
MREREADAGFELEDRQIDATFGPERKQWTHNDNPSVGPELQERERKRPMQEKVDPRPAKRKAAKKAAKKGDEDKKRKLRARQLRESRLKVGHVVAWMSCEKPETWEMRVIRGLVRLEGTVRHVPFLDEDASTSSDAEVGLLEDYDPNTMLPLCDPEKRARGVVLKRGDRVLSRAFENSDDPEGRLTTALYFGTIVMVEDRPGDFLYSVAFDDGEQDEDGEEAAEPQKHIPNSIALFSRGGA